jgi:penicillin V acylase-like amidase (Ntn superfamily)
MFIGTDASTLKRNGGKGRDPRVRPCWYVHCPAPTGAAATSEENIVCTRILWNDNDLAVIVGRTMDWPESTEPILTVFPRGCARDGGLVGEHRVVADNPLTWTSRYGSIITTIYGIGAADGINERGLAAHVLFLNACDFGARDASIPGLHAGLWAQYPLDNAATVVEALELLAGVQIVMAEARGVKATVHLALEDANGDSAIIEHIDGRTVIHHGREHKIMTNDPVYDEQLQLLAAHDFSSPSSEMALPGNVNPRDRFARAAYYSALLPKPANEREAVAAIFAITRNVSVPFGAPYKGFGIYNTEYRTVSDLTKRRYFFELTTSPNVVWAALEDFDLAPGSPVLALNPDDIELSGDVADSFGELAPAPY